MKVTYIYHSGYLVETEPATLLFDYYEGKLPAFPADKPLIVFASHKHRDHFDFKIFDLESHPGGATYVFGNDIKLSDNYLKRHGVDPSVKAKIHRMAPHTSYKSMINIHTLKSTDAGVAFYVEAGKERIYHAGDLNWWHWEGEPGNFNREQERGYKEEIAYLKSLLGDSASAVLSTAVGGSATGGFGLSKEKEVSLDAAFIPLDPRLKAAYCYGMDWFLSQIPVKKAYPMHMWEDYGVVDRYLKHCAETESGKAYIPIIQNPVKRET